MLVPIETYKEYSTYVRSFSGYHLAQSKIWFKAKQNAEKEKDAVRAVVYLKNNKPMFLSQVVQQRVLRGRETLLMPFGPLINLEARPVGKDLDDFVSQTRSAFDTVKPVFLQIEPFSFNRQKQNQFKLLLNDSRTLHKSGLTHRHADGTLTFDTRQDPETELLPKFRKDIAYNIRRAERDQKLSISFSEKEDAFESFWKLYLELQERHEFVDDRKAVYSAMLAAGDAKIVLATANQTPVAALFVSLFKEESTAVTFLSATGKKGNKLRAPTLLRWELFKWAHQNDFAKVDFFSIKREDRGYTKFKLGFRGKQVWYQQPYDLITDHFWYKVYSLYRAFARK